jgi:hypothetical protein
MKKTNAINLVLITAAMAACNRPLYQQRPNDGYDDPGYSADAPADAADSTNSCPVESSELPPDYYDWYNGAGAFGTFSVNFNINGFYAYRNPPPAPPPPLVRVNPIRSLFTRTFRNFPAANAFSMAPHPTENRPAAVRNMRASNHPTVARSGFGARVGMAVHS